MIKLRSLKLFSNLDISDASSGIHGHDLDIDACIINQSFQAYANYELETR